MLAVIHAMCIYQILGFFVSSSPAQARLSELLHLFFLKVCKMKYHFVYSMPLSPFSKPTH